MHCLQHVCIVLIHAVMVMIPDESELVTDRQTDKHTDRPRYLCTV